MVTNCIKMITVNTNIYVPTDPKKNPGTVRNPINNETPHTMYVKPNTQPTPENGGGIVPPWMK